MENLQPKLLQKPTLLKSIIECLVELLKSQNNSQNTIHKVYIFNTKATTITNNLLFISIIKIYFFL